MVENGLRKAQLFIQAAELCHQAGYYDSAASRCYYAVYRASIAALQANGYLRPSWNHGTLQKLFSEKLIKETGEYPDRLANYLRKCYDWRVVADYRDDLVSQEDSETALSYAKEFVETVQEVLSRE
ncbi:HEPN domain-containing protein [Candidatus Poribacteria bacterium]|nr:HEPN domain-containing protein [Candidatus Poribacteria bacterium]